MKTENKNYIVGFIHWKDGEITETTPHNNESEIIDTYEPMKNEISGMEFFNLKTYEITTKFF